MWHLIAALSVLFSYFLLMLLLVELHSGGGMGIRHQGRQLVQFTHRSTLMVLTIGCIVSIQPALYWLIRRSRSRRRVRP